MNYTNDIVVDAPYNHPVTKVACAVGIAWLGYIAYNYSKKDEDHAVSRKHRQNYTRNHIDKQIDGMNRIFGRPVKANPDVPHYSNKNYNRRRRGKSFW